MKYLLVAIFLTSGGQTFKIEKSFETLDLCKAKIEKMLKTNEQFAATCRRADGK